MTRIEALRASDTDKRREAHFHYYSGSGGANHSGIRVAAFAAHPCHPWPNLTGRASCLPKL